MTIMKKKMDAVTKMKLIYSGELFIFSIAFLVIAILEFTKVIKISERHHLIFNWLTIFGGTWLISDFFWAFFSKKRRKRVAIIDKIIHLPLGIYLISFDLYCLIAQPSNPDVYQYGIPCALSYLCLSYMFEAIYHFYHPIPGLFDDLEDKKPEAFDNKEAQIEETENKSDE